MEQRGLGVGGSVVVIDFEIRYSQLQLLMAKTPITAHYDYTDSWTVMITITSKLCRLQLLFNYIRL